MACAHNRIKCTNNVFFCLDCGAVVPNPYEVEKQEAPKKKRKTKKEAATDGSDSD